MRIMKDTAESILESREKNSMGFRKGKRKEERKFGRKKGKGKVTG